MAKLLGMLQFPFDLIKMKMNAESKLNILGSNVNYIPFLLPNYFLAISLS